MKLPTTYSCQENTTDIEDMGEIELKTIYILAKRIGCHTERQADTRDDVMRMIESEFKRRGNYDQYLKGE